MHSLYSALRIILFLQISLLVTQTLRAQAVPDNVFYIPLPEPQLQTAFKNLTTSPLTTTVISNTISVNISIVATSNNTVIYYDHWEDGYQANFTGTRQSSTQVWGDNDASNGIPPGYATDLINAGDRINLTNNVALPRSTSVIVYDGRDKIASTRFLSVTRIGVPTSPGSVLGSSVELYDTTIYDRSFQIPVGEASDANVGSTCCLFEYTSIFVMARENNTVVQLMPNPNSSTVVSVTLNEGESYQYTGSIVGDVLAGATVTANKPVQVDLFTGDIGAQYESRTFAMYPTALWDNCYYNPVGRTTPNADVNAFIFNPGPNSLTINARTTLGVSSFVVGPVATYRYNMPDNSGAHFYTNNESDKFFAVGVHDADATEQSTWDWGFALLPEVFLSTAAVVGYGPGSSPISATSLNGSPVWVLATQATTLYVDYDGDPSTGNLTDPNGGKYDVAYNVIADQSQRIFDNTDKDQTGLRVYTLDGTKIAVAWGEDASIAGNGLPYLDLGTTVTPEKKVLVSKRALLTVDNGQTGIVDPGDEVTYQIIIENSSLRTRNVVSITDTIPTGFSYIAGSTRRNRTTIIPDQSTPNSVFPLDENGYALGDLILNQKDTLSFRVIAQRGLVAAATVTNRVSYQDSRGEGVSGQVTISINQNYPPTANRDDVTTPFNTSIAISILGNDVDRAFRPAALTNVNAPTITTQPKRGTAVVSASGSINYTPGSTFAGRDTLIYRICDNLNTSLCDTALVTITVQSVPPVANRDDVTTPFNTNATINILTNDRDRANRPAALTNVTAPVITAQPKNGTVTINGSGSLVYDPNDTFAGRDTLIYRICDNVNNALCDTALVTITIQSAPPIANRNNATTAFNTAVTIPILDNDVDKANRPAALTNVTAPVITNNPSNGAVVVNADGSITYTPTNTFAGADALIYRICDNVNTALCDTALVTILIQSAPPTANPEIINLNFNVTTTVSVLSNDVDKANRPAALTNVTAPIIIAQPTNGSATVTPNGSITYNPNDVFAGTDVLIYRICDNINNSLCDTALVTFNVGSLPPTANPDATSTPFNTDVTLSILVNDLNRASQPASLSTVTLPVLVSNPVNGSALINPDGTLTYNPDDTFAGVDTLRYRICDNVNTTLCSNALVTITVQSAPPTANRNDVTTTFNTNITIPILDNDVDRVNRPAALTNVITPAITRNPSNGAVIVNADGSITYDPNNTFAGRDTLIYRICDNVDNSLCDTALVTITILSAPPIANPETVNLNFNVTTTVLVLTNDVDKANRPAALTNVTAPVIIRQPTNGTAVVNGGGAIVYDPNNAFAGVDTLTYRICDNINPSLCDTTFVAFNIGSQAPTVSSDLATTPFNTTVLVNILANDTDRAGQPASLSMVTLPQIVSNPVNGTAIINANGTLTYTPNPTFAGVDTLRYRICDNVNTGLCNNALVTITVQSAPPTANRDNATMMFNASLTIPILTNDVDKAGRPAALTNVTAPVIIRQATNGVGIVNSNGSITYDPGNTFAGLDTLIYRICDNVDNSLCDTALVVVSILSAPPKPVRDDVVTAFNTNITIQVLANDADKASRPAALTNVTAPTIVDPTNNGLATVNSDGTITYDPFNTFAGRDTLVYSICDNITSFLCSTALVTILIQSAPPTANRDDVTTAFNTNITIPILANDVDRAGRPTALTGSAANITSPVIVVQPSSGSVVMNADGSMTYDPEDTFTGRVSLIYQICDLIDPTNCDTAIVTITILSAPPIANRNDVTTTFNTNVTIAVLNNDADKANRPAALTNVTAPVIVNQGNNGIATVTGDGSILYNPDDTFAGRDSLIYRICDNADNTLCDTALVTITIQSAPPIANRDNGTTAFNTDITITLLSNDVDKASRPAALTNVTVPVIINQPANGSAIVNGDGTLLYNPDNTFAGRDSLIYQICDNINTSLCDTALVTITIQSAPPTANRDNITTAFNTNVTISLLANDIDRAGRPAALTGTLAANVTNPVITVQPTNGTAVINADGTLTYNPNDTFAGSDTLTYQLCDLIDPSKCDTALVVISIQSAAPVANPDAVTTVFNTNIAITVLGNDADKANRPASLTNVSVPVIINQPANGSAIVNGGGALIYNPNDTFAGRDSLIYRICDNINASLCDTALVTILIQSAPPTANRDNITTAFNTDVIIPVLSNDADKANRPAALTNVVVPIIIDQPNNGSATVNSDGTVLYNPDDTFAGRDTLIYRICDNINTSLCDTALVVITIQSAAPIANRDDVTTPFNTTVTISVLANDADKANRPASLTNVLAPVIVDQPGNGVAVIHSDGRITYTPGNTFAGLDTLVYRLCDPIDPSRCDTALVTINVLSAPPIANPDIVNLAFNQTVNFPILGNDVDKASRPANLSLVTLPVIINPPTNGMASINADGTITYNPNDTFAGTDVVTYRICDLFDPSQCDTTTVTFNVGSAAPTATDDVRSTGFNQDVAVTVLTNDSDKAGALASLTNVTAPQIIAQPVNGSAIVVNGVVVYNPNNTFAGIDILTYRICDVVDPTKCDTAQVRITVLSAPPTAQPDNITTPFNTTVQITILANDQDKASRPAALTNVTIPLVVAPPSNGVAVINPDGTVLYTPNNTFAGRDTLRYRICDNVDNSLCDTTLVAILVQSAPPVANSEEVTTPFNTNVTIAVLANDVDKASRPANLSLVSLPVVNRQPQYGVATVNADGTITYNPLDTYAGTDTLIYRICDLVDPTLCDTARVIITIQSAPPTASPDFFNIGFNLSGTVQVLANDIDKAGRPANLTNVAAPQIIEPAFYGSASVNTDGTITYTPNSAFAGSDTIVYRICDNINPSLCDTTLAVFNVGSMAPNAVQDAATTPFNTSVTINVLANDTDRTSNPASLTYITLPTLISQPVNGSAVINQDGTIAYTPTTGFAGLDTLRYQLCDRVDASLCDTTIVVFTVGSAAPTANPDLVTVPFNSTIAINVLANDFDRNGQPAAIGNVTSPVIITQPANATTVVRPNGTVVYDPLSAFAGPDTLVYRICDPVNPSLCDSALVIVLVGSAPPIANNDQVTVPFNTSVAINVLANDLDRAGQPASVSTVTVPSIIRLPSSATTVVTPNGTVVYDPLDGVAGNDTLVYRICDRVDPTLCDSALVIISNLSTSPIAFPDAVTTAFNTSLTITVLGNDLVLGGRPASLSTVSLPTIFVQPANGTASVNPDGSFTYIPNIGFTGTDTFFYRICDLIDPTLCVTAQVTIQISTQECPDTPVCIPLVVKKVVR